ncbi:hypothetical protein ABZ348_14935 [Streptomyces sp. NPDC005963]|uniref:hypothetical protein n=1 Tax=Streptomyces sp. NPDC005963 TaxID=3156721 RepID=UPI00340E57BC
MTTTDHGTGTFEEILQGFAAKLVQLRIGRGDPSLRVIQRRARDEKLDALSPSVLSAVFNGERLPKVDFVMALVRVLMLRDEHGEEQPLVSRRDPALKPWRDEWTRLKSLEPSRRTRTPLRTPPITFLVVPQWGSRPPGPA